MVPAGSSAGRSRRKLTTRFRFRTGSYRCQPHLLKIPTPSWGGVIGVGGTLEIGRDVEMMQKFDETLVRAALARAWSLQTAKQWTSDIPAAGQCNVTSVVAHDLFGGDILRTKVPGYAVDHYYNRIEGEVVDLTDSQFSEPVIYDDESASREDAMSCVLKSEYDVLREALLAHLR